MRIDGSRDTLVQITLIANDRGHPKVVVVVCLFSLPLIVENRDSVRSRDVTLAEFIASVETIL
jgi:hypothetical protein